MRSAFLIIILILGNELVLNAQNLHITYFTETRGLPSDQVRHVARDKFGFFWIACDGGLVRFDGHSFTDYSQQIPSQYGRYFCQTEEGLLLSHDAGISLISPSLDTARISMYMDASIDPEDSALYYPDRIFRQQNGNTWISGPGGRVSCIQGDKRIELLPDKEDQANTSTRAYFTEFNQELVAIAFSSGGLYVYDPENASLNKITSFSRINDLKSNGNELWIAGDHVHIIELGEDGKYILDRETFYSQLGEVTTLALDRQGNIFLGIKDNGLYYLERQRNQEPTFIKIFSSNDPHRVNELPFKTIHNIIMESDDRLWICSSEGLGILQRRFFESVGSIPNANTTSICMMEDGKVFVNFGDIYILESTDLGFSGTLLPPFSREPVTALTGAGNTLWAATSTGNLLQIYPNGRIKNSVDLRPRGEGIYFLSFDSQMRLWVCQAPEENPLVGIACIMPDGTFKEYGYKEGLVSRLLCIRETRNGRMYASGIGAGSYLYRYLPEEDAFLNLSLPMEFSVSPNFEVHDLTIDQEGVIWLASTNGLLRYDMDRVRRMDLGPEYTDVEIRAVMDMPDGSIWASTDTEGVIRYKEGETVVIKEESGLPSKVMTYRCLVKDQINRLWVGTAEGLVYSLDPNPAPLRTEKPLVSSALIDGIRTPLEKISLFQGQDLSVQFVKPSFHGFRTFYQYRTGDGAWSTPSVSREFRSSDLEPGPLKLELRARNEGGYLWSDPTILEISVREYWYKNRLYMWFFGAFVLVLVFLLFLYQRRKQGAYIDRLTQGLQLEKKAAEQRDADLLEVKKEIYLEQRQTRSHVVSMEILHRLISKITPGMKWDAVLEVISIDMLKLPGVMAFEIGLRKGKYIDFEGYSEKVRNYTSDRIVYNPEINLSSYCMEHEKAFMFSHIEDQAIRLLPDWDRRLDKYKSSISVPFYMESNHAIISVYSDRKELFDVYAQKAIAVFAQYLEQIT
jgi:ligand-binding sensor domain-containing protein